MLLMKAINRARVQVTQMLQLWHIRMSHRRAFSIVMWCIGHMLVLSHALIVDIFGLFISRIALVVWKVDVSMVAMDLIKLARGHLILVGFILVVLHKQVG